MILPRQHRTPMQSSRGFTLMEMMIAMLLVGMALTIAFAALRFASRSWERTDTLVSGLDQWRVATSVVRRQLSQMQAIRADESSRKLLFFGSPEQLEFIAPAPAQGGRLAALYRYRLRFVNEEGEKVLRLDYRPYFPGEDSAGTAEVATTVLVSGLLEGRFDYMAPPQSSGEPQWQGAWNTPERLPTMVRMELQVQGPIASWPPLVVMLPVTGGAK